MRESVAIVVVLYKAEMSVYHERLLEDEMVTLVVVDNTPDRDLALKKDRLIYVPLQRNMGIATAQNEGIRQAECLGCDYIIFFDQDSKIPERYSEGIIEEYKRIEQLIPNLFLLGPTIINGRTEEEYKSTIHKDIWMTEDFIRRREIISSGSCVSLRKIEEVGLNDDSLFIDYVDHVDQHFEKMGKGSASDVGTGGMSTKLKAAKLATSAGADMVIANGVDMGVIHRIMDGEPVGTLFKENRTEDFYLIDYLDEPSV